MPHVAQSFAGAASGGQSTQANFTGRQEDVFNGAVGAISAAQGHVTWQQPPSAAKFLIGYKNFWTTGGVVLKYDGDLAVQPANASDVTARFSLKLQWNSYIPLGLTQVLAVIVLAMTNYAVAAFAFLLMIVGVGWTAWAASNSVPQKVLELLLKNMHSGATAPAPQQARPAPQAAAQPAPQPSPAPQTPAPQAAPAPAQAAAPSTDTATIVEQIKQLAGLRDAGAITNEEFEAKKAELLSRI